jgi:hypothetical protein
MRCRPYRCGLCELPVMERPEWLDHVQVERLEVASGRSGLWEWATFWDNVSRTSRIPVHAMCTYRWNWHLWSGVGNSTAGG